MGGHVSIGVGGYGRVVGIERTASFLLAMMTLAPFWTKACAAISPRPDAPPVTRATWSEKLKRLETRRSSAMVMCIRSKGGWMRSKTQLLKFEVEVRKNRVQEESEV